MTEAKAIALMIEHLEGQFPRNCPNCGCRFDTLRDFFVNCHLIGDLISYDLEEDNLNPQHPVGTAALSNCSCGSTLALTSDGLPLLHLWSLLLWTKLEARRRSLSSPDFLQYLRWAIRLKVLNIGEIPSTAHPPLSSSAPRFPRA
jgi:hypothetical protein